VFTINVSVLCFVLESLPAFHESPSDCPTCQPVLAHSYFIYVETVSIMIFTLEYLLKLLCSPFVDTQKIFKKRINSGSNDDAEMGYTVDAHGDRRSTIVAKLMAPRPTHGRVVKFMRKPMSVVDLAAISPW
jgi:hypothetical protein